MKKGDRVRMKAEKSITGEVIEVASEELKVKFDAAPNDIKVVDKKEVEKYDAK